MDWQDTSRRKDAAFAAVPQGRGARMAHMGAMVAGIAGAALAGGLRQLATGQKPSLPDVLLTPANAMRAAHSLSQLRGAAMKLGQMMAMDAGTVLPAEVTAILASLQADAKPMPPAQLHDMLAQQWGGAWRARFSRFDLRPFAAASIGQVHRAHDGRDLAIKVQYPGVRASIDADIDNVAALLRLPGLVPRGVDMAPLLQAAKAQLQDEADYTAEAGHLRAFGQWLGDDKRFVVPQLCPDLCTPQVLAMTYLPSAPLVESLADAPQHSRDAVARALIDLTLRELFVFGAVQTDPNLGNYRYDSAAQRIVLLDFGAVRAVPNHMRARFQTLLNAALDAQPEPMRAAMQNMGYFSPATPPAQQDTMMRMFDLAMAPLRQDSPFDFAASDLLVRLRDMGLGLGRDLMHVPPAETLFLHRKIGGMYLLAAKLRARVNLRKLIDPYRSPQPLP